RPRDGRRWDWPRLACAPGAGRGRPPAAGHLQIAGHPGNLVLCSGSGCCCPSAGGRPGVRRVPAHQDFPAPPDEHQNPDPVDPGRRLLRRVLSPPLCRETQAPVCDGRVHEGPITGWCGRRSCRNRI
ncbi:hypothetical protein GGI11_006211, partial [Coemansia sp. RSA 2049]